MTFKKFFSCEGRERNTNSSVFAFCLLILFCFPVVCCKSGEVKFRKQELVIEKAGGGRTVLRGELAKSAEEQRQGYMFRKSIPDGEGMLFIYDRDEVLSFWMKNTLVPLSIAFISSGGKILEIRDMAAGDTTPVHSSRSARYALEVPQGYFRRAGIAAGDSLVIPKGGF